MKRTRLAVILAGVLVLVLAIGMLNPLFIRPARAIDIGDILLIGGIVLVVSTFGDRIDDFINSALRQREVQAAGASKVVPIFSVGRGTYVGAAQVVGVPADVRRVQGVAAIEATLGNLSGNALIPISTRRPGGGSSLNRVEGVGISAIIDFRI